MAGSRHTASLRGKEAITTATTNTVARPHRRPSIDHQSDPEKGTGKVTQMTQPHPIAKPHIDNRGDSDHTRSDSQASLRLHQPHPSPNLHSPSSHPPPPLQKKRTRTRLSPTERVYEDPDIAKTAFQAERAGNPFHRRAPTPYTSRSRRRSGSGSSAGSGGLGGSGGESDSEGTARDLQRKASGRSLRSRVSFDSRSTRRDGQHGRRGRGGAESGDEEGSASDTETRRPQSTLGVWDPGFGATQGIGPAGEAIEVIGLGRKEPRHRIFRREMLKPALRSAMSSRADLAFGSGSGSGSRDHQPRGNGTWDKPLPGRPGSIVSSVIDVLRNRPSLPPDHTYVQRGKNERGQMAPPTSFRRPGGHDGQLSPTDSTSHSSSSLRHEIEPRHTSLDFPRIRTRSFQVPPGAWHNSPDSNLESNTPHPSSGLRNQSVNRPSLRSFFSSFSRQLNLEDPPFRSLSLGLRARPRSPILLIPPAENLYSYLANVYLAEWQKWPMTGGEAERRWDRGGGGGGGKRGGMGWEWFRRLEVAERSRGLRGMVSWEIGDRHWDRRVVDWCQQNVPSEPVDTENRWGKQIFALPAQGYETLEFFDEKAQGAGDHGLLSWITGSLLQTTISVLHMLRHSSSSFAFHLIPSPTPPYLPPRLTHTRHNSSGTAPGSRKGRSKDIHALWEGFGTLVSVHKEDSSDRSLIIEIRPPSVLTNAVMREFTKPRREWWMLPSETMTGDVGQANLLQAQVFDSCIQNQVYFFVVTNLKSWVFGTFNATYTTATVSPIIDRKAREPSVMQCLTTWLVRSVDERPKSSEPLPLSLGHQPPSPQSPVAPPYSRPSPGSHQRSQSHPNPAVAAGYSSIPGWPNAQDPGHSQPHGGWTSPVPPQQQTAYNYNSYNPYPSPALTEFGYQAYPMQSGGMSMQGYGQDGVGYGYGTWSPGSDAMSGYGGPHPHAHGIAPQAQQPGMGNFWYGGTGWGR